MTRAAVKRRRVTPRQVLGVASLGAVLAFVDATIVNVAFPDIRADFPDTSLASGREAARQALEQAPEQLFA